MRGLPHLLLALAMFAAANLATAAPYPFVAHLGFGSANISTYTEYAISSNATTIQALLAGEQELHFTSATEDKVSLGFTHATWWVRFAIKNDAATAQQLFLALTPSNFGHVTAYEVTNGEWQEIPSHSSAHGFFTNKLRLPVQDFPLLLPPGAEHQYYVRIEPKRFFTYQFELSEPAQHLEHSRKRLSWPLFLTGLLCAIALYQLLLFFYSRQRTSLYLALYLATVTFSTAIAPEQWHLSSNIGSWSGILIEITFAHLSLIFFLLLCQTMLATAQHSPRSNTVFLVLIAAVGLSTISAFVIPSATTFMVLGVLYLCSIIFLFVLSIALLNKRVKNAMLVLLIVIPIIACLPFIVATQRGGTQFPINSTVPILLIAALKGFILTLSLHHSTLQRMQQQQQKLLRQRIEQTRINTHQETLSRLDQEVRTPMTAVLGMAEILTDTPLSQNQREYLRSIQAAGHNLLHILDNIIEYASLDEPHGISAQRSVNLADLVHSVATLFTDRAEEKNVALLHYFHNAVPPYVLTDPLRLKQILTNLASSALRHATAGELVLEVSMDPFQQHHVRFELSGSALKPTHDAFTPFNTGELFDPGDDVNLSIARQLVEQINGRSGVRQHNKESTLWFTLPLPADPNSERQAISPNSFSNKTLLIVDSSQTVTRILRRQTLGWGLIVSVSHDAHEALANIRSQATLGEPYDAVLFDYDLPGLNGLQFARRLHDQMQQHSMPLLLLMSSSKQSISRSTLEQNHVFGLLPKPLPAYLLYQQLMQGFHLQQPALVHTGPLLAKARVLLAMDSLAQRAHCTALLSALGANVYTVQHSKDILEQAIHTPYTLLVLSAELATETLIQKIRHVGAARSAILVLGPAKHQLAQVAYHSGTMGITLAQFTAIVRSALAYVDSEQG